MVQKVTWALGQPGASVRAFIETENEGRACSQLLAGEACVPAVHDGPWQMISEDGESITQGAQPDRWEVDRIRSARNGYLSACDWTQMPDAPLSPALRAAWANYRQQLRDLPDAQAGATLETVIWPEAPVGNL